ncbi:MAG: DUF4825 domain-containing protein [Lachnospiraceae bacterium]|nr:DUF4825 domain-containing protein [Lachnospiraceae bacterium]
MKEAIITSSILILCIILLRQICKGKISACLQYALWLIVAVRLIVPAVTVVFPNLLPKSDISIMNVAEKVETTAQDYVQLPERMRQINISAGELPYVNQLVNTFSDGPTSVFVAGRVGLTLIDFFKGIWYGGMVIIAVWMIAVNILFMKRLRSNRTKYEREDYKLPIYYAKELASPCLYGFPGRQSVYLPEEVADDEEKVRHILAHEYCHYKHKDIFWGTLRCILLAVYWFNPLVWVAAVLSKRDCELACDESAIKMLGEEERIAYGKTLLSLITKKTKAADIVCTATTMTGTGKGIKERIKRIAEKPHRLAIILLPVLVAVGALIAFTFTQASEDNRYPEGVYTLEGEGEQTVTTDCFQITFPKDLAQKIYCATENDTDVIICHKDSDIEIGRFSRLTYGEAMTLADRQEIIVIGDYGSNQMLKSYMSGEIVSVHEYHNYLEDEVDTSTAYNSSGYSGPIPAPEDVESEIINLPYDLNEDYSGMQVEEKMITDEDHKKEVTTHDYKPMEYPNEGVSGMGAANFTAHDANTDSIDDSSAVNEESIIVLPDEKIAQVVIRVCYIYVPADNLDVDEGIRDELTEINKEIINLCDSVTVLSMSIESIEKILDDIIENRDTDINNAGSTSKIAGIAQELPMADGLSYSSLELNIGQEPYSATLNYRTPVDDLNRIDNDPFFMDAVLMFALIENLDQCNFRVSGDGGKVSYHSDVKVEDFEAMTVYYERIDMEELFGELYPCSANKEDLSGLYNRVLDYLKEN